jgi:putative heme-binding domain-containing protein
MVNGKDRSKAAGKIFQLSLLLLAAGLVSAQSRYSPTVVQEGQRLYTDHCDMCHGPEGDAVPSVDLGHNKFRRASTDAELANIIKNGIPGTGMPPHNFEAFAPGVKSEVSQIQSIIIYMHYMADAANSTTVAESDAARGKAIFEGKGGCLSCHRVNGNGSRLGPELTEIGALRRSSDLESSLLNPDAEILPKNRFFRLVTQEGTTVTGRLLNQDTFSVQLIDSKEQLLSFSKADLKEYGFSNKSPMPSYKDKLTGAELADLVAYLRSLKGIEKK